MGLDPRSVRRSYDRVAERYTQEFLDELDRKPLEATVARAPYPDEFPTHRSYILARRAPEAGGQSDSARIA